VVNATVKKEILAITGQESSAGIPRAQYDEVIAAIESLGSAPTELVPREREDPT
jgi:hypothetical protein